MPTQSRKKPTSVPGIYKLPSGKYLWQVTKRVDGKRWQDSGTADTIAAAKSAKHTAEKSIGVRVRKEVTPVADETTTVEEYLAHWLVTRLGLNEILDTTGTTYDISIDRCRSRTVTKPDGTEAKVRGLLDMSMRDVRRTHVRDLFADLRSHGQLGRNMGAPLGPSGCWQVHGMLHKAFDDAVPEYIEYNPVPITKPFADECAPERPTWTLDEAKRFLVAIQQDRYFALWVLALVYGLRNGELAGLLETNVLWDERVLNPTGQETTKSSSTRTGKGGTVRHALKHAKGRKKTEGRALPLPDDVAAILRAFVDRKSADATAAAQRGTLYATNDLPYLLVDEKGRRLRPNRIRRMHQRMCEQVGVPVIHVHDLRHTCGTLLGEMKVEASMIQTWLDHANPATTRHYAEHTMESKVADKRDAANAFSKALLPPTGRHLRAV